ncbi:hypothetical protein EIK77_001941 [Talaromyces pinophilus]|nr:hypothetical protein EIK77_001941 [Talaromyces pinophilus]
MAGFLLGPVFQPPSGLWASPEMRAITTNLSVSLMNTIQHGNSSFGSFSANSSAISITALSTEDDGNSPFFDFHFSSPFLNQSAGSTGTVDNTSMYRIGSISKIFTVYTMLVNYGWEHWDEAITDYLPELEDATNLSGDTSLTSVDWNKITIGDLASQLSGIGRDCELSIICVYETVQTKLIPCEDSYGDVATLDIPWTEAGLPPLPSEDIPRCGGNSTTPPCDRDGTLY